MWGYRSLTFRLFNLLTPFAPFKLLLNSSFPTLNWEYRSTTHPFRERVFTCDMEASARVRVMSCEVRRRKHFLFSIRVQRNSRHISNQPITTQPISLRVRVLACGAGDVKSIWSPVFLHALMSTGSPHAVVSTGPPPALLE